MTKTELYQLYLTAKLRFLRDAGSVDEVLELGKRIDALRKSVVSELDIETLDSSFDSEAVRKMIKSRLEL